MQATATGCKIMFGSPQIIAWVSQILPLTATPEAFQSASDELHIATTNPSSSRNKA
jgi:hypothetical protein